MTKPPEVKGVTPKRVFQQIKSEKIFETDLEFDPLYVPWVYVENMILRTLSRMVGQGPVGPVTVKCTKEGNLAVVSRGGAFDSYERQEHAFAAAGEEHEFTLTQQVERIDIFTYSDRVEYQLTRDLVKAYGDKIELFEDSFYSLDFYTRRVKATCVSFTPKSSGTTDGTTPNKLVNSLADFVTDAIVAGYIVANITDQTFAAVTARDDLNTLSLSADIMVSGDVYTIEGPRARLMGWFQEG
ncbi:unnamed protein product, partial [marine sediment metagenome]